MTILKKLDRLDKAFFRRPISEEKFRRNLRLWWMYPALAVLQLITAMFFLGRQGVLWWQWMILMAMGPNMIMIAFLGGVFYREHILREEKRSWLMMRWPSSAKETATTFDRQR